MPNTFLLSPSRLDGSRASMLLREGAPFDLARRFHAGQATLGEIYAFISGLYFRGKLSYGQRFGKTWVIVPGRGLLEPEQTLTPEGMRQIAAVDLDTNNEEYREPLLRDARKLLEAASPEECFVLLGSVATPKYTEPLLSVFDNRLSFPPDFVGRGDMSRGGLLLRAVATGEELIYQPIRGATVHGPRVAKLKPY